MTRADFLQRLVLNAISDDLENVDQTILRDVSEQCGKCGLAMDRSDIVRALKTLVEAGIAKAYKLSPETNEASGEILGMPSLDVIESYFKTYFYITPAGMRLHLSDHTWWPFDDEDSVRPDWTQPEG